MSFQLLPYEAPDFTQPHLVNAPDARLMPAPRDGVAPEHYHAMSIFPEYIKLGGEWHLVKESRMDCVAVWENGDFAVKEFRNLKKDDQIVVGRTEDGSEGILMHAHGFQAPSASGDTFAFRQGRTRETGFSRDYQELYDLLRYEKDHGKIVWVMGPAFSFDARAREAFARLVKAGYVDAILAGNALATHDLEGAYLGTALGTDIHTQVSQPNGHYNHLDTINRCRLYGSIPEFIKGEKLDSGIICACEEMGVPYVLAGSIRDDGPLPPVIGSAYEAQDAMRHEIRGATTMICMATMLHTIAAGNMFPSYRVLPDGSVRSTYFYCVDIAEFTVNKLSDRGSLSAKGIVTNVQDFAVNLAQNLGLM